MKLTIRVEMDNAAFADDGNDGRTEAARLVEIVRLRLVQGTSTDGNLLDHNGNSVGAWEIKGRRKAESTVELGHFIGLGADRGHACWLIISDQLEIKAQ